MKEHFVMVTRTCPDCATEVGSDDLICFTCGANLPRVRSAAEPPLPITVAQKAVSADKADRGISSAVLRISFPAGNVEVPAGTSVLPGTDVRLVDGDTVRLAADITGKVTFLQ